MSNKEEVTQESGKKEVTREDVLSKVENDFLDKFDTPEKMAHAYALRDEKLHFANREAKERRLKEEQFEKELEEREKKIKEAEDKKLLDDKKYQELIEKQKQEISEREEKLKDMKRLQTFEQDVITSQKATIEEKVNTLGKNEREIYDTASQAMPENEFQQRLKLLEKLSVKPTVETNTQSGGRETVIEKDDPMALWDLKKTNPELYMAKLKEQAMKGVK